MIAHLDQMSLSFQKSHNIRDGIKFKRAFSAFSIIITPYFQIPKKKTSDPVGFPGRTEKLKIEKEIHYGKVGS